MGNLCTRRNNLQEFWNKIYDFRRDQQFIIDSLHKFHFDKCNFREKIYDGGSVNKFELRHLMLMFAREHRLPQLADCMLTLSPSLSKDEEENYLRSTIKADEEQMVLMFLRRGVVPNNLKNLVPNEGPQYVHGFNQPHRAEEVLRCWLLYKMSKTREIGEIIHPVQFLQTWETRLAKSEHLFAILSYDTCLETERERLLTFYIQALSKGQLHLLSRQRGSKEQLEMLERHVECLRKELCVWITNGLHPIILNYL